MLENAEAGRTSKYVVQELQDPQMGSKEFQEMYKRFSNRILWMDGNVVEGAFQMNTAWYFAVPDNDPVFEEHCHNSDEIIGFYSGDPNHPYDLGGELEVTIDGETRKITKSTMLFIPAGTKHMPLRILKVDRPIFHFSVVTEANYDGTSYR